nr:hypothetical protein CFP56_42134 [Quercus suber]
MDAGRASVDEIGRPRGSRMFSAHPCRSIRPGIQSARLGVFGCGRISNHQCFRQPSALSTVFIIINPFPRSDSQLKLSLDFVVPTSLSSTYALPLSNDSTACLCIHGDSLASFLRASSFDSSGALVGLRFDRFYAHCLDSTSVPARCCYSCLSWHDLVNSAKADSILTSNHSNALLVICRSRDGTFLRSIDHTSSTRLTGCAFSCSDLLQRHYTVHGKNENQEPIPAVNGMIPKSAGRTPIACNNCAKTKTKCDKKFPCSRCASRNLKCTLRPTRRSTKNVQRMGISLDGAGGAPLHIHPAPAESAVSSSPPQPKPLKPAMSKNVPDKLPQHPPPPPTPVLDVSPPQAPAQPSPEQKQGPNDMSPPLQTSGGLVQTTPVSVCTDFTGNGVDLSDSDPSPRFMLDWTQMQMPVGYDGVVQPSLVMNTEVPFDPSIMHVQHSVSVHGPVMPEMVNGMTSLITPIESPAIDRSSSDRDFGNSTMGFRQQRNKSVVSKVHLNSDVAPIIAAQDSWSVFRCTPIVPSTSCPKTARLNLELLEQTLRDHEAWSAWSPPWDESDNDPEDCVTVMQLHESTRDKLLAISQGFLYKALEIHRQGSLPQHSSTGLHTPNSHSGFNFVLLPPARVLEFFLRSYAISFERYFPLTSRGILDANELMHCYNDRAASLLVLMMIAQGAVSVPSRETCMLTAGFAEACRISLFDLIEKDIIMSGDPIVLHAALLFTVQAAWSGDKWQMDIAMGQRGMYFAMLRHSGVLENHPTVPPPRDQLPNTDYLWSEWIQNESKSRLVYSWVMVDQDLALFHDTAPLFSVTEFCVPMPDADRLWKARTAVEWSSTFEQVHEFAGGYSSVGSGARPLSLRELFRHFLNDEVAARKIEMTPMHMRLLLHPLQSQVCQYRQLLGCFSDAPPIGPPSGRAMSAASTRARFDEVMALCQRWFTLAERYLKTNPTCPMMQTNLIMFHLISLNSVTTFPEVERLARRENFDGSYAQLLWAHQRCLHAPEEAVFHCGQVLRLVRSMPRGVRPPWWAGAIYRASLILWADSLVAKEVTAPPSSNGGMYPVPGPSFAIDALPADHPLIVRYLNKHEGVPCVTRRDGSQMSIDHSFKVLHHCIELIDEGISTRFSGGIRAKLEFLART